MRIVTAAEMRALDARVIQVMGVPGVVLMENAGRAVVEVMAAVAGSLAGRRIAVVCGPGNNGGDGWVIARWLHHWEALVAAVRCVEEERIQGDALVHYRAACQAGVRVLDGTPASFAAAGVAIDEAEIIVDALLGTGTACPVEGHLANIIKQINQAPGVCFAVDLPSGLDADRGQPLGVCVQAQHTITFAFPKIGLVGSPGFLFTGELHLADIGIPLQLAEEQGVQGEILDPSCLAPLRQPRVRTGHKGTYGHALVVAGSRGHSGAAWMTGQAAARTGAGLVTVASPDETQLGLQAQLVEVMTAPLGPEPLDGETAWRRLAPLLQGKSAVAFGPGVAPLPGVRVLLEKLLEGWAGPMVLDADGLNLLALDLGVLARRPTAPPLVLTPHPAEMARLAQSTTQEVQRDRTAAATAFARTHGVVIVLKGARTVIASPDGRFAVNPTGNPGMGSGGTGDVLTGIVAALLASLPPYEAACAAVYLHGAAGDRVARVRGEAGLLARDLIEAIPLVRNAVSGCRSGRHGSCQNGAHEHD